MARLGCRRHRRLSGLRCLWVVQNAAHHLVGRAYVAVRHDDRHPFTVVGTHFLVSDLGTRFEIVDGVGQTRVLVTEGAVRFADAQSRQSLELRQGMEAVLKHNEACPRLLTTPNTNHAVWATHRFHFDHTPLRRVLADLEAYYGVRLEQAMDVEIEVHPL